MAFKFQLKTKRQTDITDTAITDVPEIKSYIDTGLYRDINGTPTLIKTKYFTGTTAAGATTNVAHGVTYTKILHVSCAVENTNVFYAVNIGTGTGQAGFVLYLTYDVTNIILSNASDLQSKAYVVKMDYYD